MLVLLWSGGASHCFGKIKGEPDATMCIYILRNSVLQQFEDNTRLHKTRPTFLTPVI